MSRPCEELELLVGRPAASLSEVSRLKLEQHLAECEACRRAHTLARSITELVERAPGELRESERERALAAAFARLETQPSTGRTARPRAWIAVAVAAAALLALGVRFLPRTGDSGPLAAHAPASPEVEPAFVAAPPHSEPAPEQVAAPTEPAWRTLSADRTETFAHARVRGTRGTRVRFDEAASELTLESGRIEVDVDPRPGAPFAVLTQSFRVQVLGTQFTVSPDRVRVRHGRVQVMGLDGSTLASDLRAGQSYTRREKHAVRVSREPATQETLSALLQRVRDALGARELSTAHALLERAASRTGSRAERAELGTLQAECALLERQPARAIGAYRGVADQFRELAAGENALFAAGQLSARAGDARQARELFDAYLARYPQGRFADEARTRLRKLAP